jgi:5-methylcytosine-specific restriction enzyme subunit McrC
VKSKTTIPIRNLFRILVHAWEDLDLADPSELDLDGIDSSGNLLARMYAKSLENLVRHGLHRDYQDRSEDLGVIRGRLELWDTVSRHLHRVGKAHCTWTELDANGPLNRALRTTADRVLRTISLDQSVAEELMTAAESMRGVEVDERALTALRGFTPTPVLRHYLPAVTLARLLTDLLVPDQFSGEYGLQDLIRNEEQMNMIFERFVRRFLAHHFSNQGWIMPSRRYHWSSTDANTGLPVRAPTLNSDVTMHNHERAMVLDCKYYGSMTGSGQYGDTLHSNNLFQIYAYLRAQEERDALPVHGVLLYSRPTGEHLNQWVDLRGIPVRMFGLDLDQPWERIEADLISVVSKPAE